MVSGSGSDTASGSGILYTSFFFCGCWFDLDLRRSLLGFINDIWDSCAVVNKLKTGAKGLILLECCFYFDRTRLSKFLESGTLFESVVFTFDWA